jgi:ribosomal protein S18 acetylase RimI-like enzyme
MAARTGFFSEAEVAVAVELVEDRLAKGEASEYFFVFAGGPHGQETWGYACWGPIACTRGSFDLYWIVVEPGRQKAGLGRALMAEVEKGVIRAGGRQIYVDTSNRPQYAPTRSFYQRCGYQIEAILKDFYAPGDDRVIFRKGLGP